jgi:putative transposase
MSVLDRVNAPCRLPKIIQVDNGPESTSQALYARADRHGITLAYSRPGTPTDIPFIEAFNGRVRPVR